MLKKISVLFIVFALLLTACGGKNSVTQDDTATNNIENTTESNSENQQPVESNDSSSENLGEALNLVLGSTDEASVFPSYHMELLLDSPNANSDQTAIVNETVKISADVEGKNIHIFQVDPGETDAKEGYIIGDTDKEYKLIEGTWQEQYGQIALAWAMWPLQVVMPYSLATSLYADKTGTEEINGRMAVVYELDTSKADPATLAGVQAYAGNMTAKGTVWIDKETGAMLKLNLDYTADVASLDGSVQLGVGNGHVELQISNVGNVTVTSPQ